MIFRAGSARPFEDFLEEFRNSFLDVHHLLNFLSGIRDTLEVRDAEAEIVKSPTPPTPYTEEVIQQFYEAIAPIFHSTYPAKQDPKEAWITIIKSLRPFFKWRAIYDITESFLGDLRLLDKHNPDSKEIEARVLRGLRRGFKWIP